MRAVITQRTNPAMELADGSKAVVDPEVQAYVSSLVTAVSLYASGPALLSLIGFAAWR